MTGRTVTESDNAQELEIRQGELLVIKLQAIPGTGYGWHLINADADLLEPRGPSTLEEPGDGLPGAPAYQIYRFRATKPGSTKLELHYRRVWEKDVPPLRSFHIDVRILSQR